MTPDSGTVHSSFIEDGTTAILQGPGPATVLRHAAEWLEEHHERVEVEDLAWRVGLTPSGERVFQLRIYVSWD